VKKWRYLRDRYVKEKRKMNSVYKSGVVASSLFVWHLYNHLQFLDEFINFLRTAQTPLRTNFGQS